MMPSNSPGPKPLRPIDRMNAPVGEKTRSSVLPPLATEGAVGFFADGVFANGRVWVTHARIKSKLVMGNAELDNAFLLQQGPQN